MDTVGVGTAKRWCHSCIIILCHDNLINMCDVGRKQVPIARIIISMTNNIIIDTNIALSVEDVGSVYERQQLGK